MVQTLTLWSNGYAEINTGENFLPCDGTPFTGSLQEKLDAIEASITASGASQIHVEKDNFRQFEHVVAAGLVSNNDFGTTVSSADFDWIMQHIDNELSARAAAAAAALISDSEGESV